MWRRHARNSPKSIWSQAWLPGHLSEWPTTRSSPTSKSNSKQRIRDKLAGSKEKKDKSRTTSRSDQVKAEKKEEQHDNYETKVFSLSDDGGTSTASDSDAESRYDSAAEDPLTKERTGSNLVRDVQKSGYSTGDEASSTDESDIEKKVKGPITNSSNTPPTPEKGTKERKERMKNATASQRVDKTTSKQQHSKNSQSTNVFNAHSPKREDLKSPKHSKNAALTGGKTSEKESTLLADSPESSSKVNNQSKLKRESEEQHSSPAMLSINSAKRGKEAPVLSHSSPPLNQPGHLSQSVQSHRKSPKICAATTEAQLQARLLRKGGHREFSSKAFTPPSAKKSVEDKATKLSSSKKKRKRRSDIQQDPQKGLDLLKGVIAKERARLQEHIAKKMKANPSHYDNTKRNVIDLTPEELLRSDDESHNGNTSRVRPYRAYQSDASQGTKRKRDGDNNDEHASTSSVKRKKSKRSSQVRSGTTKDHEQQNPVMDKYTAENMKESRDDKRSSPENIPESGSNISRPSRTDIENPGVPLSVYRSPINDLHFNETLKSLWTMIPKSLLYETMKKLNRAHCDDLESRMRRFRKGRERSPNVRIVSGTNVKGNEVDYLEENGRIIEPKPYTMSSDLTMLTAARDLIVMLSGRRVGVDVDVLAGGVVKSTKSFHNNQTKSAHEQTGGTSLIQAHLNQIAAERQREVERLQEENRRLAAKMEKRKKDIRQVLKA